MIEKLLKDRIKVKINNDFDDYIQLVAEKFAYIILKNKKIVIDHSLDPPWDHSGRTREINESYNLKDYNTFGEFIDNEYNGTSVATYYSGRGLSHNTYFEDFERLSNEWIFDQCYGVLKELINNDNVILKKWINKRNIEEDKNFLDEIYDIIIYEDIIGDFLLTESIEILVSIKSTNPIILFKRGKKNALKKIKIEHKKYKKQQKINKRNQKNAEKVWAKISKMYELKYNKSIPDKINKTEYNKEISDLLEAANNNGISIKEIQNIGKHLGFNFSNSVKMIIKNYKK